MDAGRVLDTLIAEQVMGWEPASGGYYFIDAKSRTFVSPARMVCMEPGDGAAPHWSPSTNIAAAWEVVERMSEIGWGMVLWNSWPFSSVGRGYAVRFYHGVYPPTYQEGNWKAGGNMGQDLPVAICRAALAGTKT